MRVYRERRVGYWQCRSRLGTSAMVCWGDERSTNACSCLSSYVQSRFNGYKYRIVTEGYCEEDIRRLFVTLKCYSDPKVSDPKSRLDNT